jgi:ankyrin repeat protein
MLHKEWIENLKRENQSKNFDQIINYYMSRKLRRFIQIDRKLLETKKDSNEKDKKTDDFVIVHTEEEFNEKCSQSHSQIRNVHYLIKDQDQLKWQKSNGPISTLKKYLITNKECEESIGEEDIFQKNNDKVLIISAEPGMGKSLILDHFTQNSSTENFFIKIILNTCTKTLSATNFKGKLQNRADDLFEFILKSLLGKTDKQEISLLKQLAKEEKLILMFDGLDEVIDYKEQVIQLIDALNRDCNLKKILITTRNHLGEELEDHFSTFSFNLNNFDEEDQKNFLVKYWNNLNNTNQERPTSVNKLLQSAEDLIKRIKSISSDNLNQLIGIPLQTKMLADIYFERVKNQENFTNLILTNIAELYNEFIESKIKIQFERTNNNIKIEQLSKQFKKYFDESKKDFYIDHSKLSSLILFDQKNQNEIDLEFDKKDKVQAILEYGVIVEFTNGIPTFLHQSFAEFFVAKNCLQKIKEQNKNDKELEQILRDKRHFLIRRFLNDLLENVHSQEKQEMLKEDENDVFNEEIVNCCSENLISLLKYFIQDEGVNLKTKNKFLIIASENGHKEVVAFFLENGIDANQQDNVFGETALIVASRKGYKEIVQMLLKDENIEINQQDKDGYTAFMWASLFGHVEIVQMLLQDKKIEINIKDKDGFTALMWASKYKYKKIVQMLLQDEKIKINQQNKTGATALMWASQFGHEEIVQILLQDNNIEVNQQDKGGYTALILVCREGHKDIAQMLLQEKNIQINKQDAFGFTALMWASENGHVEIVEMLLQDKNIQVNQQDNYGKTALIVASKKGYQEIVQMILKDKNIQINQQDNRGYTALMWATGNGHKEIVQMLNDENKKKNLKNIYGVTALMTASYEGHKEFVEMLLKDKNIEINKQDDYDSTALMWASCKGHSEIVKMLLQDENIEINRQDKDGYTALMWASQGGHKEIVRMLLQNDNTEINQQDQNGNSALMWATMGGHREIVRMFLQNENIKINQPNKRDETALSDAAFYDHIEIVEILQ